MRLSVKKLDIATGGVLVGILNKTDAEQLDVHPMDRVKIKKGKKLETVVVDIAVLPTTVPAGKIGVFDEVSSSLNLKNGDTVEVIPARKPLSLAYIKKKLDGGTLTQDEINQIVWDIVHNKLNQVELTYFVSACYTNAMTPKETMYLTKAMASQGETLKLDAYPVMDKHCVGGVAGNRTTMVVVPIIAASGLVIPKTSSRSITSPAGTADTMEVLAPVKLSLKQMRKVLKKTSGCLVWGGALNLAPSDDVIIRVERPLGIDARSQLLASVMAKKASVSATHVLIDIPVGKGSKIEDITQAISLKKSFLALGRELGMVLEVVITDGSQPIGNGIGPSLEARDVLWILKNDPRAPADLREKSLMLAGRMLEMGGKAIKGKGIEKASFLVESGKAYEKMVEIIKAQGGKVFEPDNIAVGPYTYDVKSETSGVVAHIDNRLISKIAHAAGAPQDKAAGIYLHVHKDGVVKKGQILFTIYAQKKHKLDYAIETNKLTNPFEIS